MKLLLIRTVPALFGLLAARAQCGGGGGRRRRPPNPQTRPHNRGAEPDFRCIAHGPCYVPARPGDRAACYARRRRVCAAIAVSAAAALAEDRWWWWWRRRRGPRPLNLLGLGPDAGQRDTANLWRGL
jgi:hypothetical protein